VIEVPGFAINVAPRTKKTHNLAVTIRPKDGRKPFQTVLPSEQYRQFFGLAMREVPLIRHGLMAEGFELPILGNLSVRALFYRDTDSGDAAGYYQGLGDFLQSAKYDDKGKRKRDGAGIIDDDRQIKDWDGSRLLIDRSEPRIEVYITVLRECPTTREMF
jgi:hypothetical protein